jgi:hypothetical protein
MSVFRRICIRIVYLCLSFSVSCLTPCLPSSSLTRIQPTTFPGDATDLPISFVERAYVDPRTTVGPDPEQLLSPVILHFKKRLV